MRALHFSTVRDVLDTILCIFAACFIDMVGASRIVYTAVSRIQNRFLQHVPGTPSVLTMALYIQRLSFRNRIAGKIHHAEIPMTTMYAATGKNLPITAANTYVIRLTILLMPIL